MNIAPLHDEAALLYIKYVLKRTLVADYASQNEKKRNEIRNERC